MPAQWPVRFSVSLSRGKRFEFVIHRTLGEMRAAIAAEPPRASPSIARAWMAACILPPSTARPKRIARMHFCDAHVTNEYVTHECVHAAMALVKHLDDSPETDSGNETLAIASGLLVKGFWNRWERIKRRLSE